MGCLLQLNYITSLHNKNSRLDHNPTTAIAFQLAITAHHKKDSKDTVVGKTNAKHHDLDNQAPITQFRDAATDVVIPKKHNGEHRA